MRDPFVCPDLDLISTGTRIFSGTLLNADLSGFTSLAERLGAHGKAGTERLTEVLNSALGAILEPVRDAGGVVLYLAGDSVTARMPDPAGAAGCPQAIHQGLAALGSFDTPEGEVRPRASVTHGAGRWGETVLAHGGHRHILLTGPMISRLAQLERESDPDGGTASTRLYVPPVIGDASGGMTSPGRDGPDEPVDPPAAEHRSMAALFVRLYGYDPSRPPIGELGAAYACLSSIAHRFGGRLQLVDSMMSDGCRVFLLFGAPVSTGRDARNAVLAGRRALDDLSGLEQVSVGIGVGYGYAYAGVVGSEWRRQYTVIGDSVNTAARLADTAAPGSIVVSEDARRATVADLGFEELPPVMAKGKSSAIRRFVPTGDGASDVRRYDFVGRDRELSRLGRMLQTPGNLVELTGEAGMGKTRLLEELRAALEAGGMTVVMARPEEPRGVDDHLVSLLTGICRIGADDSPELRRSKLAGALLSAGGEDLARMESVPGSMLLGLEYPDSPYTALTPRLRRENLLDCLGALAGDLGPAGALILDDSHLLSEEEVEELGTLLGKAMPGPERALSVLVARRPEGFALEPPSGMTLKAMELSGLDDRARRQLVGGPLNGGRLEPEVELAVMQRAQGNPFYLLQIVLYLVEKDLLVREGDTWRPSPDYSEDSLPDNVFSMIMARIDRLSARAKECLRIGSVVGMEFSGRLVQSLLEREVTADLRETVAAGLVYSATLRELEYVFSHMLIRDVAYDSLLRERRRKLHGQVAAILESMDSPAAVLAYHYELAEDWDPALRQNLRAGRRAKDEYRNRQALAHAERAAEIADRLGGREESLSEALRLKADVLDVVGRLDGAMDTYRAVADLGANTDHWVNAMQSIAQIHFVRGKFDESLQIVKQAENGLLESGSILPRYAVKFAGFRAWVKTVQGDVEAGMKHARKAVETALSIPESEPARPRLLGYAYNTLATVYWALSDMETSGDYYRKALELAKQMGMRRDAAVTLGNIGLVLEGQGLWEDAIEAITQKMKTVREIGEKYMVNSCHGELVPSLIRAGRMREARRHCDSYLRISRELVSTHDITIGLGLDAHLAMWERDVERMRRSAGELLELASEKGIRREEWKAYLYLGWAALLAGDMAEAEKLIEKALEMSRDLDEKWQAPTMRGLLARAAAGSADDAQLEELLSQAEADAEDVLDIVLADCLHHFALAYADAGRTDMAEDMLRRALGLYQDFSAQSNMSETGLELGRLLAEKGPDHHSEATEHLSAAAETFRRVGLPGRAEEAEGLAARVGDGG
ncbi:MAG: tetratricopeptide repeat protein [Candidatus Fermentibacterota bacterium]